MTKYRKQKEKSKSRVLRGIATFTEKHGYPPSYRDLAELAGIAHSLVHVYVRELRADGLIDERDPKITRAITLTDAGLAQLSGNHSR